MRHRILTCKHHPELRWSTKDIAWSGGYNGARHLFFTGRTTGQMFEDQSGVRTTHDVPECSCSVSDLILAPEDALVKEQEFTPEPLPRE